MKLSGVPKNWDRRTSIIATLGPATSDAKKIRALIDAGAAVVRLTFAHGEPDEHARRYEAVRTAERETGRTVAVLQDLAGHKIRVGRLRDGALELRQGQPLVITADEVVGSNGTISTNYPGLPRNVRAGDRILLDDGTLELVVESTAAAAVTTRCVRAGILREHNGINLPGISVDLPAITDKDVKDLAFGVRPKADSGEVPVVIATQMLEPVVHSPRPPRAETSDVATAVLDGTESVMLSAEAAVGEYAVGVVTMMDRIARAAESSAPSMFGARG